MARKKRYKPKPFESTGSSNDTSANIYESMLIHPAFLGLTKNQRLLYIYLKAQYYGKRKPGRDYPDEERLQGETLFYFSHETAVKYGLCTKAGKTELYKNIRALVSAGFIEIVVSGRASKKKSVYKFSSRWHEEKHEDKGEKHEDKGEKHEDKEDGKEKPL